MVFAEGARLRFLNRRLILAALGAIVIVILALLGGVYTYLKSPAFEARARQCASRVKRYESAIIRY